MAQILIVDDDDHQRPLYREELLAEGYEVLEAREGREALAMFARATPDAVVLDVNMPGMDGLDTLMRIHDRVLRLPMVLNSAHSGYQDSFVCRRSVNWSHAGPRCHRRCQTGIGA